MKLVGSHGSLSLLFMTKVMVWHFVSNSHKLWLHSSMCYLKLLVEISLQFHVEVCWHAYSWGKVMNLILIFNYLICFVHQMYTCPCCTMDAKECLVQWEFAHDYLFQPNQRKGLSRFVYNDFCFHLSISLVRNMTLSTVWAYNSWWCNFPPCLDICCGVCALWMIPASYERYLFDWSLGRMLEHMSMLLT
jgi:hypothetical protein